jgi:putative Mg2+ transporter-C (MgtC) family protein
MLPYHEILLRLLFAAALGSAIGIERDVHRRPAGIRTSMFVCTSTALFTILSAELAHLWGDSSSTRIASNIVQGIGFLGAGAIIKDGAGRVGMTTAATIFLEAAIGMAAGAGLYRVAGSAAGITLFGLIVLGWAMEALHLKPRTLIFRFTTSHAENVAEEVQKLLAGLKVRATHFRVSMAGPTSVVEFEADVSHRQQLEIVSQLNRQGIITEIVPVDGPHG